MKDTKRKLVLIGASLGHCASFTIRDYRLPETLTNIETKKSFKKRSKFDQLSQSNRDKGIG